MRLSYVLPLLRHSGDDGLEELTDYLRWLSSRVEVIVADGSDAAVRAEHGKLWEQYVTQVPVTNRPRRYGKVIGVHAGVAQASHEKVIIADDDVRYSDRSLGEVSRALDGADLVRPQNYFSPLPWFAAWDTGRILLNRALGSDSPGTLGIRRDFFLGMGGYSDEAMYENLELMRTVAAHDGRIADRPDIFVRRLPGTVRRFWEQRPRQAYDDWSSPTKLVAFLSVVPTVVGLRRSRLGRIAPALTVFGCVALAERGRRRHEGAAYFPFRTAWFAPLWVAERSLCVWLALVYRLTGGVPYAGTRFRVAAHSVSELRRRAAAHPVAPVAEWSGARAPAAAEGYD